MPLSLNSSRFETLEVSERTQIEFPFGLIGLPGTRYALIIGDDETAVMSLQSVDECGLAIPVADPFRFFGSYAIELTDDDAARVGGHGCAHMAAFVTIRTDNRRDRPTVNLRAPILVSEGRGYQVINQAPDAPLRAQVPVPALSASSIA